MQLTIELSGYRDEIVISKIPVPFLSKIVHHCYGKNNTPYFAHNCFKGVLYFDEELAKKFAEATGYQWNGWWEEKKFYHRAAYALDDSLSIRVLIDNEEIQEIYPSKVNAADSPVRPAAMLPDVPESSALVLMGAVDKGTQTFTLDGLADTFNPARLSISCESFQGFGLEEQLITGMTYGGVNLTPGINFSKGKRVLDPVMISPGGDDWDMDDIISQSTPEEP